MIIYRSSWIEIRKEASGFALVLPYVSSGMTVSVKKTLREAYREARSFITMMQAVEAM